MERTSAQLLKRTALDSSFFKNPTFFAKHRGVSNRPGFYFYDFWLKPDWLFVFVTLVKKFLDETLVAFLVWYAKKSWIGFWAFVCVLCSIMLWLAVVPPHSDRLWRKSNNVFPDRKLVARKGRVSLRLYGACTRLVGKF